MLPSYFLLQTSKQTKSEINLHFLLAGDDEFADPEASHELLFPAHVPPPHAPRAPFPHSGVAGGYMPSPGDLTRVRPRRPKGVAAGSSASGRLVSSLLLAQHKATRDTYVAWLMGLTCGPKATGSSPTPITVLS